jgi:hypothetical protein
MIENGSPASRHDTGEANLREGLCHNLLKVSPTGILVAGRAQFWCPLLERMIGTERRKAFTADMRLSLFCPSTQEGLTGRLCEHYP